VNRDENIPRNFGGCYVLYIYNMQYEYKTEYKPENKYKISILLLT